MTLTEEITMGSPKEVLPFLERVPTCDVELSSWKREGKAQAYLIRSLTFGAASAGRHRRLAAFHERTVTHHGRRGVRALAATDGCGLAQRQALGAGNWSSADAQKDET